MRAWGPDEVVLLPLYPHYSTTTTGSSLTAWREAAAQAGLAKPATTLCCYHAASGYVAATAACVRRAYEAARAELAARARLRVLFSAHGLPETIVKRGDPYQFQVERTVAAVVRSLAIPDLDFAVCYQSRATPQKWIDPSTEEAIERAATTKSPCWSCRSPSCPSIRRRWWSWMWNTATWRRKWACPAISGRRRRTATLASSRAWPTSCGERSPQGLACAASPAAAPAPRRTAIARTPAPENPPTRRGGVSFTTALPLRLVIFDCDGVLVDSEGPSNRAVAEEVTALGWPMTEAESTQLFIGCQLGGIADVVEAHLGRPVPEGWVEHLRRRIVDVLSNEVEAMPGAAEVLAATAALGLPIRVASNSSHREMQVKFARTGLAARLQGRTHSAYDVAQGKPAPDVYLAAAAAEGVPPGACAVVEDSVPGTMAAVAAGMACIGLDAHGDGAELRAAGAHLIRGLRELPPLFQAAMRRAA